MIVGNPIGCVIANPDVYLLQDENGNEYPAVMVSEETVFTATTNDIRQGKTAATAEGVVEGEKVIPAYHTHQGAVAIPVGSVLKVRLMNLDTYDYTKFQAIVCDFNTSLNDSVLSKQTVINDNVYEVLSKTPISEITKDDTSKSVIFGIENTSDIPCIIRYFTYKEIE